MGTVAWWSNTAPHGDDYEIHNLDGTLVKNFFAANGLPTRTSSSWSQTATTCCSPTSHANTST